jgi:hypothetical protein
MAGSGWGAENNAKGDWYAAQDFNFRNLRVHKGEKLPSAWQIPQNVSYLKQTYGEGCIEYRSGKSSQTRKKKSEERNEWTPIHKEPNIRRKQKAVAEN